MRFGCCIPPKDYATAKAVGFDFVEFPGVVISAMTDEEMDQLCQQLADRDLPCISINSYCNGEPAIVGDRFDEEKIRAYAELLCSRAKKLGATMIGVGAPAARRLPAEYDWALADAQCRSFLEITADVAAKYGIRINYESLSTAVCNYGIRLEEGIALVQAVDKKNLSLVVDFYHRHLAGEALCDFTGFEDLIFHTHISTCGPQAERGYPGMDELAYYREIVTALKAAGYDETMSIEAHTEDLLQEGQATLAMLRLADKGGC